MLQGLPQWYTRGVEHVKGVFTPIGTLPGGNNSQVSLAPLASWTATSFLAAIDDTPLPATTSAMDFSRGAYRVASRAGSTECVQSIYAHRGKPHLIVSEFECVNKGGTASRIMFDQGRCNPNNKRDAYIYDTPHLYS